MAVTVIAAAGFMFGGGALSDRLGMRVPILLAFLAVSFVGFLLLTAADSVVGLVVACVLIGTGQGGTSGPLIALLADLTPDERMGRAMGTNNVLGDIGGGLGPMISLPLVESVGFTPVYTACALVPLLAGGSPALRRLRPDRQHQPPDVDRRLSADRSRVRSVRYVTTAAGWALMPCGPSSPMAGRSGGRSDTWIRATADPGSSDLESRPLDGGGSLKVLVQRS